MKESHGVLFSFGVFYTVVSIAKFILVVDILGLPAQLDLRERKKNLISLKNITSRISHYK